MACHCPFNLQFPDKQWLLSTYLCISVLFMSYVVMSLFVWNVFLSAVYFVIGLFALLLVYRNSLYILDRESLSDTCIANIFFQIRTCLLFSLPVPACGSLHFKGAILYALLKCWQSQGCEDIFLCLPLCWIIIFCM